MNFSLWMYMAKKLNYKLENKGSKTKYEQQGTWKLARKPEQQPDQIIKTNKI